MTNHFQEPLRVELAINSGDARLLSNCSYQAQEHGTISALAGLAQVGRCLVGRFQALRQFLLEKP